MTVQPFDKSNGLFISEAAELLASCFPQAYADCADVEITSILEAGKLALMAVEDGHLIGFVGAMPQYETTGWELHPLAVADSYRGKGVGTALVSALEKAAAQQGCVTMYLGTDDEFGRTSLSDTDLYEDTFEKIRNIKNLRAHPYEFYQKVGYTIVGVIPDANGIGKPDIWMAKESHDKQGKRRGAAKAAPRKAI